MAVSWKVRINEGAEQDLTTRTGVYRAAAAAALAMLKFEEREDGRDVVEIWVPELVSAGYRPGLYQVGEDEFGNAMLRHVVRVPDPEPI